MCARCCGRVTNEPAERSHRLGWNIVGLVLFVVIAFPIYWMIATAFKPDSQIYGYTPTLFPTHPTLQHFQDAINHPTSGPT